MINKISSVAILIMVVLINAVIFIYTGGDFTDVQLLSVIFINVACALLIVSPFIVSRRSKSSYHHSVVLAFVASLFLIAELIIAAVVFMSEWGDLMIVSIIHIMLAGLTVSVMIMQYGIMMPIDKYERETKEYRENYVTDTKGNMSKAFDATKDKETKNVIEDTMDKVNSMPFKSKPETIDMDAELLRLSAHLFDLAKDDSNNEMVMVCKTIDNLVDKRNGEYRKAQK